MVQVFRGWAAGLVFRIFLLNIKSLLTFDTDILKRLGAPIVIRLIRLAMSNGTQSMKEKQELRPASVIGPLGEAMTLADLPSPSTTRWVIRRKAEVVAAVNGGLLSCSEARTRYGISLEELVSWQLAVERSGMQGLRVTRLKHYRDLYDKK